MRQSHPKTKSRRLLRALVWWWTPLGRVRAATNKGGSSVLSYDAGGRLSEKRTTSAPSTVLETFAFHTADGWRTSQRRSGESSVTYSYDAAGHLTGYHKPAGAQGATTAVDATYTYDALGQRSLPTSETVLVSAVVMMLPGLIAAVSFP